MASVFCTTLRKLRWIAGYGRCLWHMGLWCTIWRSMLPVPPGPPEWKPIIITTKELVAIVFSCSVWGRFLSRKRVQLFCDNLGLVKPIRKGESKDNIMMHFLRCLGFCFSQPTMTFTSQFHTFGESKTRQQTCCQETSFNNSSSHSRQPLAYQPPIPLCLARIVSLRQLD